MFRWLTKTVSAVLNTRSFRLTDTTLGRLLTGGLDSSAGKPVTVDTALQLSAVWACVRLIAGTIATLPLGLYGRDGAGNKVPATDHPLYALLHDQPNADMTAVEFWEAMVACLLLWGNAYARKDVNALGDVISLTPLPPDRMGARRQPDGSVLYIFTPYNAPLEELTEDQLFHIKGFSLNGLIGLSPISYARNSLGLAMAADEAAAKMFANGMSPAGFIETGGPFLTQEQRDDFKDKLEEYRGSQNAGKFMLLEGNFRFNQLTVNPDDMQLLASREHSIDDICRWFQTPAWMIGHMTRTTSWGTGLEQQMIGFLTFTLRPWLSRIEQTIKARIIKPADRAKGIYAEFSVEGLLRADSAGRAALYAVQSQNGLKTRDEIRQLENDPPMGGNATKLTVQSNLVPLDKLGEQPAAQTPEGFGHPATKTPPAAEPVRQ